MDNHAVHKYLSKHAETEVAQLTDFPADLTFAHCLVIPAYDEGVEFFTRLQLGPLHNQQALCVAVINQPDDVDECEANRALMHQMILSGEVIWHADNMQLVRYAGSSNLWLLVDRFSSGVRIPAREGVGRARKIGCDIAAALIARTQVQSRWIHSTDADTFLPRDYFNLPREGNYSACVYDFKHMVDDTTVGRATALYEQAIRYYAAGLAWAGSPYAFPTLGSVLALDAQTYCLAHGFPRRAGGEDFYLLNKLAKLGAVHHARDITLRIAARLSSRVPFGTGPKVTKIAALKDPETEYTYYDPVIFEKLRDWIAAMADVWPALQNSIDPLRQLPDDVTAALHALDIDDIFQHLNKQIKTSEDALQAMHHWFDAFKTLKFVHWLQEHRHPPLPLQECLRRASFTQ